MSNQNYQNETKSCQNCKNDFTIEPDDFSFYEKIKVPPPTFCPECRMIRRLSWRNERNWHKRVCDKTGKSIISVFSKDCTYKVYDFNYWKSDDFDPLMYGQEYDFSKDFFTQFNELLKIVPHPNLIQKNNINCEYSNYSIGCKNCYVVASAVSLEDCYYAIGSTTNCKNCLDLLQTNDCESSYELIDCVKCFELFFGQNCEACISSYFLYDCRNCANCIGCVGLRNKSYCIFNEQYSKESWLEEVNKLKLDTLDGLLNTQEKFNQLKNNFPRKYAIINKAVDCIGDDISNAINCKYCFYARKDVENLKYIFKTFNNVKDGYDGVTVWDNVELFYEVVSVSAQRVYFSQLIWGGFDIEYSFNCFDCNNIFGCIGLRNKSYCIFNKQYSKEEYIKTREQIIKQMETKPYINQRGIVYTYGEFLPSEFSPFGYNDSLASDYFSKNKQEALLYDFNWQESEIKDYKIDINSEDINKILLTEDVLNKTIECKDKLSCNHNCSGAFRVANQELNFYQTKNIPIPQYCINCRHGQRVEKKTPLKLWHRKCMKEGCQNEFETSYAPDKPEIVYCEKCYQQEVY